MPLKSPFLTGVLSHVPEGERGKAETELIALEEGSLRQADYSKLSSEARTTKENFEALHAKNLDWFEANKAALDEAAGLRTKVTELEAKVGTAAPGTTSGLTKEDLDKHVNAALAETERGAVSFITESNKLGMEHFKTFGDVLDLAPLLADKRIQQIGLRAVYNEVYKPQLTEKSNVAIKAREDALREEGRQAERTALAGKTHPYPVVGNEHSSLDAIEAARAAGDGKVAVGKSADELASEYVRLQGQRTGAPA